MHLSVGTKLQHLDDESAQEIILKMSLMTSTREWTQTRDGSAPMLFFIALQNMCDVSRFATQNYKQTVKGSPLVYQCPVHHALDQHLGRYLMLIVGYKL